MIAKCYPIDIRFIEMMPLGLGKMYETYSNENILQRLKDIFQNKVHRSTLSASSSPLTGVFFFIFASGEFGST